MSDIKNELQELNKQKQLLHAQEGILLEKGLKSDNPEDYLYALQRAQSIDKRQQTDSKALLIDPMSIAGSFGYKNSTSPVSFHTLRKMAKVPLVRSIIETRVEQVAAFCEPQSDKYSTGFVIRRKKSLFGDDEEKVNEKDKRTIEFLTNFILNGGVASSAWHADSFDTFVRKIVKDSLALDQMGFEVVRNRGGKLHEFFAVDGCTLRIADSYDDETYQQKDKQAVQGYFPSYVQVYQSQIKAEFYPWELCYGIRNPTTNIYNNGYGESELEDLVSIVTSMLWADQYNSNFFRVGSAPKGILKISGDVSEQRLAEFRQQWMAQMAGVLNSHKLPVLQADKMDFINTNVSNRDMEYSKYYEFLIKLTCALYKLDPSEIGFPMSGSAESKPLFEGNNAERIQYSKDKGLRPLLKFIQAKVNKYIISQLNPDFEFVFVGFDAETAEKELDNDIKAMKLMGLKEIRRKRGLPDQIDEDDVILNPDYNAYMQREQAASQYEDQKKMMMQGGDDEGGNQKDSKKDDNPIAKSFNEWWEKETYNDKL